MADYKFILTNSMTGIAMEELGLSGVTYSYGLNGTGEMSGSLSFEDPKANPVNLRTLAREIVVLRNNVPVFAGPIVGLTPTLSTQEFQIRCASVWWWMTRSTAELDLNYTNVDIADIAWEHIDVSQQKVPGGSKRITKSAAFKQTGQKLTRNFPGAQRKYVSEVVDELAVLYPGFDYMIELRRDQYGVLYRDFKTYAPFKGVNVDQPLNPRNGLTELSFTEDGTQVVSRVHELGATTEDTTLLASKTDTTTAGIYIPMVEDVVSRTDITDLATLNLYADADLFLRRWPLRAYSASYIPNDAIPFGAISPGDNVLLDAHCGLFHINVRQRVVMINVNIDAGGEEKIDVTFNELAAT
jgi:hypothetical protein